MLLPFRSDADGDILERLDRRGDCVFDQGNDKFGRRAMTLAGRMEGQGR